MNHHNRSKNKLVTNESLFIRGPLSRLKELVNGLLTGKWHKTL